MKERGPFKIYRKPEMENPSLVVGWREDAGRLGPGVIAYLKKKLGGIEFAEIEPEDFFPLNGVAIENDVARLPESRFFYVANKNLAIFESDPPRQEWHRFLSAIFDLFQPYGGLKELYTVGGMVSLGVHTNPREMLAIANMPEMKETLDYYEVAREINFETPPDQRPTLSSYLVWLACQRGVAAANLWVPVPFYLMAMEDPRAWREAARFLSQRLDLWLDLAGLEAAAAEQDARIARARGRYPELNGYISRMENNLSLSQEENARLIETIEEILRERINNDEE